MTGTLRISCSVLLTLLWTPTFALDPVIPGAGNLQQQIDPPQAPVPPRETPILQKDHETLEPSTNGPSFWVQSIQFEGNTLINTAILHALVADAEGKNLSFGQLKQIAAQIASYYHTRGYPLVQAILPAQTVKDGVVVIRIIEARYGEIKLDNQSAVNPTLLAATLAPLSAGQVIAQDSLSRSLLLLSDIPGVNVNAVLQPGVSIGLANLVVHTQTSPTDLGSVQLDNYGNTYTGRTRVGATLNQFNPFKHGDVLSLYGLASNGDMSYGRLSYETTLNGAGTQLGGAISALHYGVGGEFSALNAHGVAQDSALWLEHPLQRSENSNLHIQTQYDHNQLRDEVDAGDIHTDRHLDVWSNTLSGDMRDTHGATIWRVVMSTGRVAFDNDAAQQADSQSAQSAGGFNKWNASLVRLQSLSTQFSLYALLQGQWANSNLDAAEKMVVGGPFSVRAYDVGALSADTGFLQSLELRYDVRAQWYGHWQIVAFEDNAHVMLNANPWSTTANSATLSGGGLGLNWDATPKIHAKCYIATPIGSTPTQVGLTQSTRVWSELTLLF